MISENNVTVYLNVKCRHGSYIFKIKLSGRPTDDHYLCKIFNNIFTPLWFNFVILIVREKI